MLDGLTVSAGTVMQNSREDNFRFAAVLFYILGLASNLAVDAIFLSQRRWGWAIVFIALLPSIVHGLVRSVDAYFNGAGDYKP